MTTAARTRLVISVAVVVLAAAAFFVFRRTAHAPTTAQPTPSRALGVPAVVLAQDPTAGDLTTLHKQITATVPISDDTRAAIDNALTDHLARSTAAAAAIADARAGRIDAVELGQRLKQSLANHPEVGHGVLKEMIAERSPQLTMQMALSLATVEDDATLRNETIDALRAAPPEARAVGLMALQGRGEPEAVELAADSFAQDSPEARATAGFLLNNAPSGSLDGDAADQALAAARAALADPSTPVRIREEAATLLGRPGATPADLALLESCVFNAELSVRVRALAALEATGMDHAQLIVIFTRVAHDPNSPEQLVLMAQAYLGAQQ